jgi:hypothetical protein
VALVRVVVGRAHDLVEERERQIIGVESVLEAGAARQEQGAGDAQEVYEISEAPGPQKILHMKWASFTGVRNLVARSHTLDLLTGRPLLATP